MKTNQVIEKKFAFSGCDERINRLIDSIGVGVLLQGPESQILFSNQTALELLGLSHNELNSSPSLHPEWNAIHEDGSFFPGNEQPVPVAIRTKKSVTDTVMGVYRPLTEDLVWLLVNAEPLLDESGNVKEVICCFSDITNRKEAEEKMTWLYQSLEIRAMELANMNSELAKFVNVATHDLQEPLRMVSSFTQLLKKKYESQLDEKAIEYINYAVEGAAKMKKLLLDLLVYSRFIGNKEGFNKVDLNKVVKQVSQSLSKEVHDSNAELCIPELPLIYANEVMMTQLFENIFANAIKFKGEEHPKIKIEFTLTENHYQFSIQDNGIGIAPEYAEKIFVLFQRLHSGNLLYGGTGVGLAVCKKITELHDGRIWVTSKEGQGSTFYFTISKNLNPENE